TAPELTEHPAQHIAALPAQDEVDRGVVGQVGHRDIVVVDAIHDELADPLADERLELDSYRRHHTLTNFGIRPCRKNACKGRCCPDDSHAQPLPASSNRLMVLSISS